MRFFWYCLVKNFSLDTAGRGGFTFARLGGIHLDRDELTFRYCVADLRIVIFSVKSVELSRAQSASFIN